MFWFLRGAPEPVRPAWRISPLQRRQLLDLLSRIGLGIVAEARGPVPLLTFGRRVLDRLQPDRMGAIPLADFADALKQVIREMSDERLRVMSPTDFTAVGYVYNAHDPETWPIRSSL
jgi:hypothetical protein